jgi:hypothetical protein
LTRSLCAVVLLLALGCGGASARGAPAKLQVLFVGNSLTAANDLPAVVASLSRGAISYRTVAPGGVSLEDHWNFTGARDALDGGEWDYVVLQQGPSTLPESAANLREWTVRWADAIRHRGARPALYEVWPDSAFGVLSGGCSQLPGGRRRVASGVPPRGRGVAGGVASQPAACLVRAGRIPPVEAGNGPRRARDHRPADEQGSVTDPASLSREDCEVAAHGGPRGASGGRDTLIGR